MKKRIMIMTNSLYSGGAEKVMQTFINNLDYGKYDLTLYSMHRRKIDPEVFTAKFDYKVVFDKKNNSKLSELFYKIKGKIFATCPPKLFYFLFIKGKYDIEIAFIEGESTKIISGSTNKKSKKLTWVHTDMIKNPWTYYLFKNAEQEAKAYRKFDEVICVSNSVKDAFKAKYNIHSAKVKYNPVDSNDIIEKAKEPCNEEVATRPLLVTVGRLEEPKGYPRLLECADKLNKENIKFTLWIIGDGSQREQLEAYIETNHLQDTVKLLGFHNNPYKFINQADAFICSSYIEGFSTAATEALIIGKPIYTLDCPGMAELFGNENCGEIVPNTDEELYSLLKRAATDSESLKKYADSAKRRAEYFNIKTRMTEIENQF